MEVTVFAYRPERDLRRIVDFHFDVHGGCRALTYEIRPIIMSSDRVDLPKGVVAAVCSPFEMFYKRQYRIHLYRKEKIVSDPDSCNEPQQTGCKCDFDEVAVRIGEQLPTLHWKLDLDSFVDAMIVHYDDENGQIFVRSTIRALGVANAGRIDAYVNEVGHASFSQEMFRMNSDDKENGQAVVVQVGIAQYRRGIILQHPTPAEMLILFIDYGQVVKVDTMNVIRKMAQSLRCMVPQAVAIRLNGYRGADKGFGPVSTLIELAPLGSIISVSIESLAAGGTALCGRVAAQLKDGENRTAYRDFLDFLRIESSEASLLNSESIATTESPSDSADSDGDTPITVVSTNEIGDAFGDAKTEERSETDEEETEDADENEGDVAVTKEDNGIPDHSFPGYGEVFPTLRPPTDFLGYLYRSDGIDASPSLFYMMGRLNDTRLLTYAMRAPREVLQPIVVGSPCMAVHPFIDGLQRARVIDAAEDLVTITFIDDGNTMTVGFWEVFSVREQPKFVLETPAQALPCRLDGVSATEEWSLDAVDQFQYRTRVGEMFAVEIVGLDSATAEVPIDVYRVRLYSTDWLFRFDETGRWVPSKVEDEEEMIERMKKRFGLMTENAEEEAEEMED